MRRRPVVLAVILIAGAILASAAVFLRWPSGPGVTKANFDRIEPGMTLAAVEAVLGPPRDDSPSGRNWSILHNGKLGPGHTRRVWGGDHGGAVLVFDANDVVLRHAWVDDPESFWSRLRRLFRRLGL